jgi:adenine-specific DNA-methyltransferase
MLDFALTLQTEYENSVAADRRRERGQVFTPPGVARFMASLFTAIPREFVLLDPGAGLGALTAAVCERIRRLRSPRSVTVHLFENDGGLIPLLRRNLEHCRRALCDAGHTLRYVLHEEDFILAASPGLNGRCMVSQTSTPSSWRWRQGC